MPDTERTEDDRTMDDRRVVITGASSGIGRSTAHALIDAGASVALLARSATDLDDLATTLGADAHPIPCDVTDPDAVVTAVDRAAESMGGLDAVVNSAGVVRPGGIAETTPADWKLTFDVNVLGLLHVTAAALDHLRAASVDGVTDVINISSMSGRRRASIEMTIYSASKFAVHVISDGLREELSDDGIRVTIVSPGYVRTPIFDDVADDELRTTYQKRLSESGLDPDDVARQVVHALSQPAGVDLLEIAAISTRQ